MEGLLEDANLTPLDNVEGVTILSLMNVMGHMSVIYVLSLEGCKGPSVHFPVSHIVPSKAMNLSQPIAAMSAI